MIIFSFGFLGHKYLTEHTWKTAPIIMRSHPFRISFVSLLTSSVFKIHDQFFLFYCRYCILFLC